MSAPEHDVLVVRAGLAGRAGRAGTGIMSREHPVYRTPQGPAVDCAPAIIIQWQTRGYMY